MQKSKKIKLALAIDRANSALLDPNTSLEIISEAKKNLQDALNNTPFDYNIDLVEQIKTQIKLLEDTEYLTKIRIRFR